MVELIERVKFLARVVRKDANSMVFSNLVGDVFELALSLAILPTTAEDGTPMVSSLQ